MYWLTEDEITIMAGRCYVELCQPDRAVPLLTGVLARYDERQTRESALYTRGSPKPMCKPVISSTLRRLHSARWNYPLDEFRTRR